MSQAKNPQRRRCGAEPYDKLVSRSRTGRRARGRPALSGGSPSSLRGGRAAGPRGLAEARRGGAKVELLVRSADGGEEAVAFDPESGRRLAEAAAHDDRTPASPRSSSSTTTATRARCSRWPCELEGFEVAQAANGLRLISAMHVDRPDVILLDVMMSWIDGFELCRAIKKNPDLRRHPGHLHLGAQERRGRAGRAATRARPTTSPSRSTSTGSSRPRMRRRSWPSARRRRRVERQA